MKKLLLLLLVLVCVLFATQCSSLAPEDVGSSSAALVGSKVLYPISDYPGYVTGFYMQPFNCAPVGGCPCTDQWSCQVNVGGVGGCQHAPHPPHVFCVNDPLGNNHNNYVSMGSSSENGHVDWEVFKFTHIDAATCAKITAINDIKIYVMGDTTAVTGAKPQAYIGTSILNSGAEHTSANSWLGQMNMFGSESEAQWQLNTNPTTGVAWTVTEFCGANNPVISGILLGFPYLLSLDEVNITVDYTRKP